MDDFDKKILQIKKYRNPEIWLDDIFINLVEFKSENFIRYKFYKKDNIILFYYKQNVDMFYYHDIRINNILINRYRLDESTIEYIIYNKAKQYLNLNIIPVLWNTVLNVQNFKKPF